MDEFLIIFKKIDNEEIIRTANQIRIKVHLHYASAAASKNNLTVEVHIAVEVADGSVCMNRSICCHRTHCLRQVKLTPSQALLHRVNGPLVLINLNSI